MEAAELTSESLAKKLQEALLLAKLEDFQREGVKALPLSATSCVIEVYHDAQAAFTVVDIATNYDFSNLSSLEVDERNAQQFVEQLGPGKRPLWAVPVVLRPKNAGLVLVFACVFRESGSMRSHMAKNALKELKHWTLRNSQQLKVTFFDGDAGTEKGQRMLLGGPELAIQQMPKVVTAVKGVPLEAAAERALRELLRAEEKEEAKRAKREEKSGKARPVVFPAVEVATRPGSETEPEAEASESSEVSEVVAVCGASNRASILQLLTGWLGSVRAEESCHKVVNANYWHYRRNENACWRLSYLQSHQPGLFDTAVSSSAVSTAPNPWMPLPELEPDGREPQLLANNMTVEPPGLEPELSDTSLWRHLLRGTHGFSLQGPGASPVSLFPEAPEVARTARVRQRNAGWRRWWLSFRKMREADTAVDDTKCSEPSVPAVPMLLMPVPVHLCWKVQQYIEELQREEWNQNGRATQQMSSNSNVEQVIWT